MAITFVKAVSHGRPFEGKKNYLPRALKPNATGPFEVQHVPVGWMVAMDLGVEDLMVESNYNIGPTLWEHVQGQCQLRWRKARLNSLTVTVTPTSDMQGRGGILMMAVMPVTLEEAQQDAKSKINWCQQYSTPTSFMQLPNAIERSATRTCRVTYRPPAGTQSEEWMPIGIPGYQITDASHASAMTNWFRNDDGAVGAQPIVRIAMLYQDMAVSGAAGSTADVGPQYKANKGQFEMNCKADVSLAVPVGSPANKFSAAGTEEVGNSQVIRHRPVPVSDAHPKEHQLGLVVDEMTGTCAVFSTEDSQFKDGAWTTKLDRLLLRAPDSNLTLDSMVLE
jgi:hypothetical protein